MTSVPSNRICPSQYCISHKLCIEWYDSVILPTDRFACFAIIRCSCRLDHPAPCLACQADNSLWSKKIGWLLNNVSETSILSRLPVDDIILKCQMSTNNLDSAAYSIHTCPVYSVQCPFTNHFFLPPVKFFVGGYLLFTDLRWVTFRTFCWICLNLVLLN